MLGINYNKFWGEAIDDSKVEYKSKGRFNELVHKIDFHCSIAKLISANRSRTIQG